MRYKFYVADNKIVCVSSFAGKAVRGIAKCNPTDTFDLDAGKKLAQARCDYKIAEKRVIRSKQRYNDALRAAAVATDELHRMDSYYTDSFKEFIEARENLEKIEKSF